MRRVVRSQRLLAKANLSGRNGFSRDTSFGSSNAKLALILAFYAEYRKAGLNFDSDHC